MDVVERLSLQAATAPTLLACEHRHRYELARELCGGMRVLDLCCGIGYGSAILAESASAVVGVDNDPAAVDAARATVDEERIRFELGDAVTYIDRPPWAAFDAVVCFEGLEHLPELERVLNALRRHADNGTKLVVSVPNSEMFSEQNPYHLTDFSYEKALAAFSEFRMVSVLPQYLAEGSVMCPPVADSPEFTFVAHDRLEIEYANHFIICVGFDSNSVHRAHRGRIQVQTSAMHNRHTRNLEVANTELRRANARLARMHATTVGSAAAARLFMLQDALAARELELRAANDRADQAEQARDAWKARCSAAERADRSVWQHTPGPVEVDTSRSRPMRANALEVHHVESGAVIYQARPERVHHLNNTAAVVFELCDGQHTVGEIAAQFATVFNLDHAPTDLVERCVAELRSKDILV